VLHAFYWLSPGRRIRTGLLVENDKWNAALTASLAGDQYWQDSNLTWGTDAGEISAEILGYGWSTLVLNIVTAISGQFTAALTTC